MRLVLSGLGGRFSSSGWSCQEPHLRLGRDRGLTGHCDSVSFSGAFDMRRASVLPCAEPCTTNCDFLRCTVGSCAPAPGTESRNQYDR